MRDSERSQSREATGYALVFLANGAGFLMAEWAFKIFAFWSARCVAAILFGAAMALNRKLFR